MDSLEDRQAVAKSVIVPRARLLVDGENRVWFRGEVILGIVLRPVAAIGGRPYCGAESTQGKPVKLAQVIQIRLARHDKQSGFVQFGRSELPESIVQLGRPQQVVRVGNNDVRRLLIRQNRSCWFICWDPGCI